MDTQTIQVIIKPDWISWKEITNLLHEAYKENVDKNMHFLASHQNEEITKKRVGDGICIVALKEKQLVGTMTLNFYEPTISGKRWHNQKKYAYASQDAVHPDFKGRGVGNLMEDYRINLCKENNIDELLMHTSINATKVIKWWERKGAEKIELLSSSQTNYYAVRMRLPILGKKFNSYYVKYEYYKSCIKMFITTDKYGRQRFK